VIKYLEVDDLVEIPSIVLGETPQVRDFGLLSSAAA
jgi:death-on-curing protein